MSKEKPVVSAVDGTLTKSDDQQIADHYDSAAIEAISAIAEAARDKTESNGSLHEDDDDDESQDVAKLFPPLTKEEVINCMFSSWYPKLQDATFKSEIIMPLEKNFLTYLLSDGVFLPDSEANPVFSGEFEEHGISKYDDMEWSEEDEPTAGIDIESTTAEIRQVIKELGGTVFPRMNWSSPRDAVHMTTSDSLKCTNPSQIYLLLKSSYNIASDIENGRYMPREQLGEFTPELVLRQWCNLVPSMEFRCFVKDRNIVAISQIDPHYYDFLEGMTSEILAKISELFEAHIRPNFSLSNYCFDAYIARTTDKTYIVDLEPWTHTVEPILFEWEELLEMNHDGLPEIRFFPDNVNTMRYFTRKRSTNRYPVEMTSTTFQDTLSQLIAQTKDQAQI
ncbi:hypothetical protein EV177_002385 [Coemansia sp. RSA 1804]|nr:hypothetical protein EV177_002385 [Coemansia sp. RSA 1804]